LHAERLADIALATPEPREEAPAQAEPRRAVAIELRNVAFRYGENEPWVLQGVSFRVEAGERVAIVGPSGCGKTTLLRIVLLSDPILEQSPSLAQQAEQKVLSGLYRGPIDRVRLAKSGYSVRRVDLSDVSEVVTDVRPKAGDLVLARVKRLGQHQHLEFVNGRRSRLWPGDEIVVAFGARYAPDQYEAVVPDDLSPCQLVAGGGIAGRVVSRHANIKPATDVEPLGLLVNAQGVINVRGAALGPSPPLRPPLVVAVVGSSMNAGKTTTAAHLIVGLRRRRLRVGA